MRCPELSNVLFHSGANLIQKSSTKQNNASQFILGLHVLICFSQNKFDHSETFFQLLLKQNSRYEARFSVQGELLISHFKFTAFYGLYFGFVEGLGAGAASSRFDSGLKLKKP